ncbi:MAG: ABC transporter permease [Acetatifactor sp.]
MKNIRKSTFREIKSSVGRFAAMLAIIALGVGFFAGLKVTRSNMVISMKDYLDRHGFYDFRLVSTWGFEPGDIEELKKMTGMPDGDAEIEDIEASISLDVMYNGAGGRRGVVKTMSLPDKVNTVELVAGRMPENSSECVADSRMFGEDAIGTVITIAPENEQELRDKFVSESFTLVGLVQSPLYVQFERGNTSLGTGRLDGFIYLQPEAYHIEYDTDIYVRFRQNNPLYGDAYIDYIEGKQELWEQSLSRLADRRYQKIRMEAGLAELEKPETYVLGRNTNVGYVCFENDSNIVEGIANVFPVFFFLVAALVCITTMNRMVEEQRTQIGVLKALGYSSAGIMSKYMTYSGLAAVIGCVSGFFLGTWGFPKVIWVVYGIMYNTDKLLYVFDWRLAFFSVLVSLLCSVGATWFSCRLELAETAAQLMRPKAPKAGKRVFLEKLPFLWKRLSFLRKVSVRNIFRYKKRFFMMLLGISGCTALMVTGFGIKDSIADVAERQYREIQVFDLGVSLKTPANEELETRLTELSEEGIADFLCLTESNMDIVTEKGTKSIYVVAGDAGRLSDYVDMHTKGGEKIAYPGAGEGVITQKLADRYGIAMGDEVCLRDGDMHEMTVKITAVMENYVNNYLYLSEDTMESFYGGNLEKKTVYVNLKDDADPHALAATIMELEETASVDVNQDTVERVGSMMESLNIIVVIVIICAAGLAFIVLYNLTNINITERIREIATIKVLGFFKRETESYVFRENLLLTVLGMFPGLVLGKFLHAFVMSQIQIDLIAFDTRVAPVSYLYSAILTVVFAWLVNRGMSGKLENVSMTESLKSVD